MGDAVYFVISKAVQYGLRPETWGLILMALAIWRGRRWAVAAFAYWVAVWALPLGAWLIAPLERQIPPPPALGSAAAQARIEAAQGLIVLGGWEDQTRAQFWDQPAVGDGAERAIIALALARAAPKAQVIVTGGRGTLRDPTARGQGPTQAMLYALAGGRDRFVFERQSRSTAEHPAAIRKVYDARFGSDPRQGRWILVTSASHMPRSLAVFCTAGWTDLDPWPVDYRSGGRDPRPYMGDRLRLISTALNEWVGIWGYRATGKITPPCG